ncbi:rhomboid family intramembrane serine protease [Chitinophaga sp. NPDC101104]|uniref:rhomboid family intramembrane serine protease n=1 Tax=Chitinophaga sp. NPDC101104 TaxID=3390561 RepID=UPI003D08EDD5
MKRMIITEVTGIVSKPMFRKDHFRLKLADKYLRKLYLPKKDIDNFNTGDRLRIEISEFGKQVIRITPATERIVSIISRKKEELPSASKRPYLQALFNGEPARASVLQVIKSLFIPTKDRIVSMLIIDINILVFVLMLLGGVSIHAPQGIDIVNWGGNYGPLTIGEGQYWRMFTCNFVHIGIVHLLMNLIGFVLVAYFLESVLGWKLFLFTYIFTGLLSSVASLWWHSDVVSAGASGAIFGMYGMLLMLLLTANKRTRTAFSGLTKTTLLFVGYNLLMGIAGSTDNAAHIGGLLSGFLLGGILLMTGILKKLVASKTALQNSPVM